MTSRSLVHPENLDAIRRGLRENAIAGEFLPAVYVIEPTNICDLNCVMCPNSKFEDGALGTMSVPEFTRVVELIAPYAELTMLYFLGETTLHPHFKDLLQIARNTLRGQIVLSTNAFALDTDKIDSINANVDLVIACIDRWNPSAYERIRIGSRFSTVVASVEHMLARRGELTSPRVVVKGLDIRLPGDTQEQLEQETDAFERHWKSLGAIPLVGWLNTWAGQLPKLKRLAGQSTPYEQLDRGPCADLWFKMVVNWRSEVVLCCHDWSSSVVVGKLTEQSLGEVWHNGSLRSLRKDHVQANYACNNLCRGCKEWGTPDELEAYMQLSPADLYRVF